MNKETEVKLKRFLKGVFDCALLEEYGSSEHITEYVTASRIKLLCDDLGFDDLVEKMEEEMEKMEE